MSGVHDTPLEVNAVVDSLTIQFTAYGRPDWWVRDWTGYVRPCRSRQWTGSSMRLACSSQMGKATAPRQSHLTIGVRGGVSHGVAFSGCLG